MTKDEILAHMKAKGKADALDLRSRAKDLDGTALIAEENKIPQFDPTKDYSTWAVGSPVYEIVDGERLLEGTDNVLKDQSIRFKKKENQKKYPGIVRRIVYYAPDLHRTFTYYTNNFYLSAKDIALLYKYRWQVELFFKWIKQHLQVKRFWGDSENAVRIQIHVAIITYCLIAIIEHDLKIGRPVLEIMRILGKSALTMDSIRDLLMPIKETANTVDRQLYFDFKLD